MGTKPLHRLHVSEITSIGVVPEGDAPLAHIAFWKKAPTLTKPWAKDLLRKLRIEMQRKNPAMSRKQVEAEILRERPDIADALGRSTAKSAPTADGRGPLGPGRPLSVADRGKAVVTYVKARLDAQDAAVAEMTDDLRKIGDEMTPMAKRETGRSAESILAEVDRLANTIQKSAGGTTRAEAKAEAWRAHPELAVEIRKAQARERVGGTVADGSGKPLTAEWIAKAVHARAAALRSDPRFWDKTEADLRAETWRRTEGLRDAYVDATKDPDGFEKSRGGEHAAVLATIRGWSAE